MPRFIMLQIFVTVALVGSGCSESDLHRTRGRVTKGGEDFVPGDGEDLQIGLMPISSNGTPPMNYYFASVDQETGTFTAAGPRLEGVPAGKYRVTVELMKQKKDQFEGRFDAERSPFVVEIDDDDEEIVVDLDRESLPPPAELPNTD
jgi:hypothetical protein